MIPLFTEEQFNKAKAHDKLKCKCCHCNKEFFAKKNHIKMVLDEVDTRRAMFCSNNCQKQNRNRKQEVKCKNCGKLFLKTQAEIKKNHVNHFCSKSCSATYNNKHKSYGTRRSKLEIFLEEQLTNIYPKLEIFYNNKEAINSELDIYIPSLNLAFELNGIFHYEPIFGDDKLEKTQNNDKRKFQACLEKKIEFVTIDVSQLKYFKPQNAEKYLEIIIKIINIKL
jgi:hypothetical protein